MVLASLWNGMRGSVRFSVRGEHPERLLNLAARAGIELNRVKHEKSGLETEVAPRQYKKLRPLARRCQVRTRVTKRRGLPFFWLRLRKRPGLAAGAALCLGLVLASGCFVWDITIQGAPSIPAWELREFLREEGLHKGSWKRQVDVTALEQALLIRYDSLSWAAVNLVGTVAQVELQETTPPPGTIHRDQPCNVVASKGGTVVSIDAYDGKGMVRPGTAVKKGDLLVSGIVQGAKGGTFYRHAQGKVLAQYTETRTFSAPVQPVLRVPDGDPANYKFLCLGGLRLPLFLGPMQLENCFTRTFSRPARLQGSDLPWDIQIVQAIPWRQEEAENSTQRARQLALSTMEQFERSIANEREILQKVTSGKAEDGRYVITAQYRFLEDISQEAAIQFRP